MSTAAPVSAERRSRPNGWWGTAIFLTSEATLFGTLVGTYFYLRLRVPDWPPGSIPQPRLTLPLVLTGALAVTSLPMLGASRAAAAGRVRPASAALLAALAVQSAYLGWQIDLFVGDLDRFTPQGSAYGSIYFTLLGAHHAHVALGLLFSGWLLLRLTHGLTRYRADGVRAAALYWHVVNALALVVTLTQVSPRL